VTDDVADPVIVVLGIIVTAEEGADLVMTGTTVEAARVGEIRARETETEMSDGIAATAIDRVTDTEAGEAATTNSLTGVTIVMRTDTTVEMRTVVKIHVTVTAIDDTENETNLGASATVIVHMTTIIDD